METSILIRRLTGTGKGKEETLLTQEVSLGTGPHNTVRFDPTWDRGVAATHARIYRDESGAWQLQDADSGTGTFINGQRITMKRQVGGTFVLELGQGGPKVEINVPGEMPRGNAAPGVRPGAARAASGGGMKWLALAACVGVLGAGAWFFMKNGGSGLGGDTDERLQNAAKSHEQAVGLVICATEGKSNPIGTAWAVGDNQFATNAHVAVPVIQTLEKGGAAYVVLNKAPEKKFRITAAVPHPRYFDDHLSADGKNAASGAYDVGLLLVDGPVPVKFPIASAAKLEKLDSGHRVAFLGFPMEGLANDGVDAHLPVATMQSGILTSVTDFWLAKADTRSRLLLQHNLPAVGGASGSPIFDADGEVVGILNGGNIHFTVPTEVWAGYVQAIRAAQEKVIEEAEGAAAKEKLNDEQQQKLEQKVVATLKALKNTPLPVTSLQRAPSAALINFGQRIDMLADLMQMVEAAQKKGDL